MRHNIFDGATLNAAGFSETRKALEWPGGVGWLVVANFVAATGAPVMEIEEFVPNFSLPTPISGLPSQITAAGVYPFSAPEGVSFSFVLKAAINDTLTVSNVYLLSTPA